MLKKLWQKFLTFIRRLFGKTPPQPAAPVKAKPVAQPLSDIEYETKFLAMLEEVSRGMGRGYIKGNLLNINEQHLTAWLRRFGAERIETPESHAQLAENLIKFCNLWQGELAEVALEIGKQIKDRLPVPVVEEWAIIEA